MSEQQAVAGRTLQYPSAELVYVENTVSLGDLEPAVNELARDFMDVRITRRWAGPMATPLFGDVATAFVLGTAAGSFLSELGKDIYSGLRSGLFAVYKSAKTWANGRGYAPFAIENRDSDQQGNTIHLQFPRGLSQEQFDGAIKAIPEAVELYGSRARLIGLAYNGKAWEINEEV